MIDRASIHVEKAISPVALPGRTGQNKKASSVETVRGEKDETSESKKDGEMWMFSSEFVSPAQMSQMFASTCPNAET